jgi:hypothetical protein
MSVHTGTIVPGQGHASKNSEAMIREIAKDFPSVVACSRFGTINVRLDLATIHQHADHWTPQITWDPVDGLGKNRTEAFGFIRVKFEYRNEKHDAWVVLPEGHPWTYNGQGVEIIADRLIPGIAHQEPCSIHIEHRPSVPRPAWLGKIFGVNRTGT